MNAPEITPLSAAVGKRAADALRRRALLVLGMHRSGTSALARMLSLLGCDLPATLIPPNHGNEAGHWESRAVAMFNDQLLAALGSAWDDWLPVNPRFRETPQWPGFVEQGREVLRREFADSPMFVLKDPRICRLLPFWLEVLASEGVEPAIVIPLRNPVEVARSLAARDGFDEYYGILLWLRHVLDAEVASRGRARAFVSYDGLLEDWESVAAEISASTGVVWPRLSPAIAVELEGFLGPDLRHHVIASHDLAQRKMLSPWISEAYAILRDWVARGEQSEDYGRLDAVAAAFNAATPMFARPMLAARETKQNLARSEMERTALRGERDGLVAERDTLIQQQDAAAGERVLLHEERDSLTAERDAAINARDALLRDHEDLARRRDAISGEHDRLATELAALAEERDALAGELRTEQLLAGQHWTDRCALEAERNVTQAYVARLERDQAQSADGRRELEHRLAVTTSTLRQREEEIEQLGVAHARQVAESARDRDALTQLQAARSEQLDDLVAAHAEIVERSAENAKLTDMLMERESELGELRKSLENAKGERAALMAGRDAMRAENDALSSEVVGARDEIAERFKELSQLTFMLRSSEDAAHARDADVEWLLKVHAAMASFPAWWALAPARLRQRWAEGRLKRHGLFDAEAYHARHGDVAEAGMASLRHYLLHGLREGRSR